MKHCQTITVRRAEVDPEQQAFLDFLDVTFFRVIVAAVALVKSFV